MTHQRQAHIFFVRFFSVALAVLLASCASRPPALPELECPLPPEQNCRPGEFTGKPLYDTVSTTELGALSHYHIVHLDAPANSRDNEFGVAFVNVWQTLTAAITTDRNSDTGRQNPWVFPMTGIATVADGTPLNGFNANGGTLTIDRGTMTVYFSALRVGGQIGDYDIFSAQLLRDGPGWKISSATSLGDSVNREFSWDAQPAISSDGNTLYFASDRPGGVGGTDIWKSTKHANGSWSKAENCGPVVNTECDEITPFVPIDGNTLYYSSTGRETVGGYDIFRARINNNVLHAAENIGAPVNTAADEIFPSTYVGADSLLYYASTQAGGMGGFDLYVVQKIVRPPAPVVAMEKPIERPIEMPTPVFVEKIKPKPMAIDTVVKIDSVPLTGSVVDQRTHVPISDATITWKQLPSRTPTGTVQTDTKGEYNLSLRTETQYEISAQAGKYFYDVFQVTTPAAAETVATIHHSFSLPETLALRINFPLNQADRPYDYTITDSGVPGNFKAAEALDLLAENLKYYKEKIKLLRLIGHTDSLGSDVYNDRLGLRRAQYVKNQLVARGIPADLIVVESKGRREPVPRKPGEPQDIFDVRCRRTELSKEIVN